MRQSRPRAPGRPGRGFTVVAQQVRKLADRSARAASEIADLVQAVLDAVRRIAADAKESFEVSAALKSILERISATIQSITDLAQAATEGVGQADSSLGGMVGSSSDTSGLVDGAGQLQQDPRRDRSADGNAHQQSLPWGTACTGREDRGNLWGRCTARGGRARPCSPCPRLQGNGTG